MSYFKNKKHLKKRTKTNSYGSGISEILRVAFQEQQLENNV